MEIFSNRFIFGQVENVLAQNKSVKIRLVGSSMSPLLLDNRDIITLIPAIRRGIKVGDVVLAKYLGDYVMHRIIKKDSDGMYVLQGDAMTNKEECVKKDDIVGLLIAVERDNIKRYDTNGLRWNIMSMLRKPQKKIRYYCLKMYSLKNKVIKRIC